MGIDMDKQKQIEELQAILPNIEVVRAMYGDFDLAKLLYDKGVRKIPENAVVLTVQDLDLFCNIAGIISPSKGKPVGQAIVDKIRKETAEKYHNMVNKAIVNMKWARDDTHIKLVTQEACLLANNEICKEIIKGEIQ
jgi:hypothetical protein